MHVPDEQPIIQTFSDFNDVVYSNWCTTPNSNAGKQNSSEFLVLAEMARNNGDWSQAIQYYFQVLYDSLTTSEDFQALKGNLVCYSRINQITSYISWLDDKLVSYILEDEFRNEILNTRALCNRFLGNYQVALDHYVGILDNASTDIDSSFALIDMGFTWLESNGNVRSKYSNLMPSSIKDHILNTRQILDCIRNPEASQGHTTPTKPILYNNYPNPFNPSTTIEFSIPNESSVNLSIYNIKGQKVKTLIKNDMEKGQHRIIWDGRDDGNRSVASGVYFIRLKANGKTSVKKAILLK